MTAIFAPDGPVGAPPLVMAKSPSVLAGLRIGVLDNGKPNARRWMQRVAEQIAERSGAIVSVVTTKGPNHNAATPCSEPVYDLLKKEVDLVITGSAD